MANHRKSSTSTAVVLWMPLISGQLYVAGLCLAEPDHDFDLCRVLSHATDTDSAYQTQEFCPVRPSPEGVSLRTVLMVYLTCHQSEALHFMREWWAR